jgi:hypothetical protein
MEPDDPLMYLQEAIGGPYAEQDGSSSHSHTQLL